MPHNRYISLLICAIALTVSGQAHAKDSPGRYHNEAHGLTMEIPQFKAIPGPSITLVHFFAPPVNGFAPNVNVQAQYIKMDLNGYIDLSKKQFKTMGLTLTRMKKIKVSGLPAVELEYHGTMHNRKLSFLAIAIARKDHFILLTGTSLQSQIGKHRAVMWQAIRSIKLRK